MDLIEGLMTRRSIRQYKDENVSETEIIDVIKAGMYAPSAGNQQVWRFVTFTDKEKLAYVAANLKTAVMAKSAAFGVVLCAEPEQGNCPEYWEQDCSAAIQNMQLACHAKGIGAVWIGIQPHQDRVDIVRKGFGIPDHVQVHSLLIGGYAGQQPRQPERFHPEFIRKEKW